MLSLLGNVNEEQDIFIVSPHVKVSSHRLIINCKSGGEVLHIEDTKKHLNCVIKIFIKDESQVDTMYLKGSQRPCCAIPGENENSI